MIPCILVMCVAGVYQCASENEKSAIREIKHQKVERIRQKRAMNYNAPSGATNYEKLGNGYFSYEYKGHKFMARSVGNGARAEALVRLD